MFVPSSRFSVLLLIALAAFALGGCASTPNARFAGPDLSVSASELKLLPATPTEGELAVASIIVRSAGTQATQAVQGAFYVNGQLVRPMVEIPALQPGEYREYRVEFVPGQTGRTRLEFHADPYDVAREVRTYNNRAGNIFTVLAALPATATTTVVVADNGGVVGGDGNEGSAAGGEVVVVREKGFDLALLENTLRAGEGNGDKLRLSVDVANLSGVMQDRVAHVVFTVDGEELHPARTVNRLGAGEQTTVSVDFRPRRSGQHRVTATIVYAGNYADHSQRNDRLSALLRLAPPEAAATNRVVIVTPAGNSGTQY